MRGGARSVRALSCALVLPAAFLVSSFVVTYTCQAITASYGHPYQGHLENGVVFPSEFPGYHLRDPNRSYTTPEVVGALLDAIEAVRTQFPDTCDVFIGDFTVGSGGAAAHHRSHQNGRDVDIGMYAKGNRPLTTFMPMNEDNLDAAKTWCLIENLISSQRVQYIFLDRRVQKVLYDYAVSQGYDQEYLRRVFGNVPGSLIQHIRNHYDHMHVRFFTPWSTLAAHIGPGEGDKMSVVEMAQQSYLPSKVNYYVNGSEKSLPDLASSFGVTVADLCRWNHISSSGVPGPGTCLVFYKRSFESEPVLLARSLQPGFIAGSSAVRMASLEPEPQSRVEVEAEAYDSDDTGQVARDTRTDHVASASESTTYNTCKARRGDTLDKIARRNKLDVNLLCQLNGIRKSTPLRVGQTVKTGVAGSVYASVEETATDAPRGSSSSSIGFSSDPQRPESPAVAYYTVTNSCSLRDVSKKTGIPISSLCQINGLSRSARLRSGQKIKLTMADTRVATEGRRKGGSSICFDSVSKKPDSPTAAYYRVNNGGTLTDVSKKTGIPLSVLCQLNGLSRNAHLRPGQKVKLTQANLPVKPVFGTASCSLNSAKKSGKLDKKSSKPEANRGKSKESASTGKHAAKDADKSGKSIASHGKATEKKPAASKSREKTVSKYSKPAKIAKR